MKKIVLALLLGLLSLGHMGTSNAADYVLDRGLLHEILPYGPLDGTIWMSTASRAQLQTDRPEQATRDKGAEIDIHILASFEVQNPLESGYSIKVNKWKKSGNPDVNKSATLVSNGENSFVYTEHSSRPLSDFSGAKGHGIFRIIDKDTAELTDVRQLADGSAQTSVTTLHRVDTRFGSPIAATRPPAQ